MRYTVSFVILSEAKDLAPLAEMRHYVLHDGMILMKMPAVYIVTNNSNKVLYTGVTAYPRERAQQHREGLVEGFSKKYNCQKLVYIELCDTLEQVITREKQIKVWLRKKKITLIEQLNPEWNDLYETINA